MKKGDRVVLSDHKANVLSPFWQRRNVDCNSIGTIFSTLSGPDCNSIGTIFSTLSGPMLLPPTNLFVEVQWDNGSGSVCNSIYLELYESKNISLPNLKFKRRIP